MLKFLAAFTFSFLLIGLARGADKLKASDAVALQVANRSVLLQDLQSQLKEVKISVNETHSKIPSDFVGFSFIEILDHYAPDWKKHDGVLVTALDGYKSDLSVAKIQKFRPVLAYRFAKGGDFKIDNPAQNEKDVELGPFFLVWDNLRHPELQRQGNYDWPYQVARLEPIHYASHYAKAFPFKHASSKVVAGFEYFKNYCMTCHSVTGKSEGGEKGPILHPYPALFQGGLKQFTAWTTDPHKLKPGTTMPPLNTNLTEAERKEVAEKIYAYLSALHKK